MKQDWICPCCGFRMGTLEFGPTAGTVPKLLNAAPYGICMQCGDPLPPPSAAGHMCIPKQAIP